MTERGQRSIAKIRTFGGDVSRARSASDIPDASAAPIIPSPAAVVTHPATVVPSAPQSVPSPVSNVQPVPLSVPPIMPRTAALPSVAPSKQVLQEAGVMQETINELGAPLRSITTDRDFNAIDDPLAGEGTIVSDKRRKRFKLFPAIGTAVSGWAQDTKSNFTKKESTTISTVESRLDTLKAAAQASHQVPQDDHGVLIKRITESKRETVAPTANIKAVSEVAAPSWTHTNETTASAGDGPLPEPVRRAVVKPLQEPTPMPVAAIPIARVPEPPVPRIMPAPVEAPRQAPATGYATYTPQPTYTPSRPAPAVSQAPAAYVPTYTPPQAPLVTAAPVNQSAVPTRAYEGATPRNNRMILTFILIIIGASLLGVGTTVLWYLGTNQTSEVVTPMTAPRLIATNIQTPVAIGSDRTATLDALLSATLKTAEIQQIYLTGVDINSTVVPADAAQIFTALSFRLPGNFSRSVRTVSFGSYRGTDPFIVMRSSDFSTAFAGMLAWEPVMSVDLVPLFGPAVSESFDPTARTATQVRAAFFRDTIIANVSARVLVNAENEERIVYGFVKPNLILIAPNEATFTAIAPLLIETP